ncbi:MAG: SMC-Scp complex subunit ScpB [Calditrichaeota bacterium]|nr:MAG: SMC-Scp complex subunit ScpB [Calditrichota bacterium]
MEHDFQKQVVEALIFASDAPLSENKIATIVDGLTAHKVHQIVEELNQDYQKDRRSFFIKKVAGGFQFASRAEYANWIKKLYKGRAKPRLSQASLETLAIVAFKQPVTRTEIDAIRGVDSGGVLKTLLERNFITIAGRAETVGKPLLYKTTDEFLKYFGLNDISELPKPKEIEEILGEVEKDRAISEEVVQTLSELEISNNHNEDGAVE